ncbi:unnamed protein product [Moneuplotes crassus]|uniref:Uncharacterized protein n=1 Tax=Euplotes crassus TaxID=5936 RepID=A0A7S3K784_EUPCR|nr:unnamed protein product [Moneuplotes crassus]|mmetsp:Transcript_12466/g.12507  ORF Transcript_12466/g.12507 Transcript_12466/m.12507 type:complete len:216 (+) Transcript_12466:19-666(+)
MKISFLSTLCLVLLLSAQVTSAFYLNKNIETQTEVKEISSEIVQDGFKENIVMDYLQSILFWMNRKFLTGFSQGFEGHSNELPSQCMDEEFQGRFITSLADVFADILNGNIFEEDLFDDHLNIFTSNIANELVNACSTPSIVIQVDEWLDDNFEDNNFLVGLALTAVRYVQTAVSNIGPFFLWHAVHIGSSLTFQFYWFGYSLGKILRIFFLNES